MRKLNYSYLINHLKISTARQAFFFEVLVSPQVLSILKILLDLNIVRRFYRVHGNRFRIFPSWSSKNPTFSQIRVYRRVANPLTIKYHALQVLQHNLKSSHLILSTPYGLLPHREAMRRKTGGQLICLIH